MLPDLGRVLQGLRRALPGMCSFQKKLLAWILSMNIYVIGDGFVPLHSWCAYPPSLPIRIIGMWNSKLGCDYTRCVCWITYTFWTIPGTRQCF